MAYQEVVRDAARAISDADIENDETRALRGALLEAEATHRDAVASAGELSDLLAALVERKAKASQDITEIDSGRAATIVDTFLNGGTFSEDDRQLEQRSKLQLLVDRITIAEPAIRQQHSGRQRAVSMAADHIAGLQRQIEDKVWGAKLVQARATVRH